MNAKQLELVNEVLSALDDPDHSPYAGQPFNEVIKVLAEKLKHLKKIEAYEKAMGMIK